MSSSQQSDSSSDEYCTFGTPTLEEVKKSFLKGIPKVKYLESTTAPNQPEYYEDEIAEIYLKRRNERLLQVSKDFEELSQTALENSLTQITDASFLEQEKLCLQQSIPLIDFNESESAEADDRKAYNEEGTPRIKSTLPLPQINDTTLLADIEAPSFMFSNTTMMQSPISSKMPANRPSTNAEESCSSFSEFYKSILEFKRPKTRPFYTDSFWTELNVITPDSEMSGGNQDGEPNFNDTLEKFEYMMDQAAKLNGELENPMRDPSPAKNRPLTPKKPAVPEKNSSATKPLVRKAFSKLATSNTQPPAAKSQPSNPKFQKPQEPQMSGSKQFSHVVKPLDLNKTFGVHNAPQPRTPSVAQMIDDSLKVSPKRMPRF